MEHIDWDGILAAYNDGLTADMVQADFGDQQGVIWTVPPCSPAALERAGRQFLRSRALAVRHIRRAVLRRQGQGDKAVVILTDLPARHQQARDLTTAEHILLRHYLNDEALASLEAGFMPSAAAAER